MQIVLNFPPTLAKFDATSLLTSPSKPQTILTPTNGQVTIDPNVVSLEGLIASGFTLAPLVTTTANRPTVNLSPGLMVIDLTLNTPIWRDATNTKWISAAGATV